MLNLNELEPGTLVFAKLTDLGDLDMLADISGLDTECVVVQRMSHTNAVVFLRQSHSPCCDAELYPTRQEAIVDAVARELHAAQARVTKLQALYDQCVIKDLSRRIHEPDEALVDSDSG